MDISIYKHQQFLKEELNAEMENFALKFSTSAMSLLKDKEELFVAQLMGFKNGEMIMKFPNTRTLPRKGEFLTCMALPAHLQKYGNWGDMTYRDLYAKRIRSTEAVCVWHSPTDDARFSLVGFTRIDFEFAEAIRHFTGIVLAFGPQRPPIDYIVNLQKVVDAEEYNGTSGLLNEVSLQLNCSPQLIKQSDVCGFVKTQLSLSDSMILQGPPGTGKTRLIAELCSELCKENRSVLVTAFTNHALIEVADKDAVKGLLREGKLFKTSVTTDEIQLIPELQSIKEVTPMPGCLVLSSYYITSGLPNQIKSGQPFDYVIMDEASQALLAMFMACRKIGKHFLYVGDIKQLPPIVSLNEDRIKSLGYRTFVRGLETLTKSSSIPLYQLTNTYRFGRRAANYTGLFYNDTLSSRKSEQNDLDLHSIDKIINPGGGPALVLTDMPAGDYTPQFGSLLAAYIIGCVRADNKNASIAVLTCMRKTCRNLQRIVAQNLGASPNIIVETVARIQGLTTDVTVFFVPNTSYIRVLEPHLFNVATSRAKEHTIIIMDRRALDYSTIDPIVRRYLEQLKNETSIYIPCKMEGKDTDLSYLQLSDV